MADAHELIEGYLGWLLTETKIGGTHVGEGGDQYVEIVMPYLDSSNDYIVVYTKPLDKGGHLFTDGGSTFQALLDRGCDLSNPTVKAVVWETLKGLSVQLFDRALVAGSTANNYPLRLHNLVQAMLILDSLGVRGDFN